ncbi:MAG: carbon-nitrogen hydrolase [Tissierellia bacterium]|nr:carbon-nitrogen hydrolase [Tissierellia bacterium]
MSRKVNIGIIQFESVLGDVEHNVTKAAELIKEAANKGANIVCLPELFATGYNLSILKEKVAGLSIEYYDYTFDKMSQAAKENNVYVLASFGEIRETPGIVYNSTIVFDDEGKKIGSFAKSHLWALDRLYFREGSEYPVFNTKYGKIGIMICYDAGFPEVARALCLGGAEIIFIPAAWRIQDVDMWDLNVAQRALENILFTVGVNRVGKEEDLHLFGKSKICNPRGTVIAELPMDQEVVEVVTIDLDDINKFRTEISYLRDRKPQIYTKLVEKI